jgi:hypothetical protein
MLQLFIFIWINIGTAAHGAAVLPTYTATVKYNDRIASVEEETEWSLGCSSIYCAVNYQINVSTQMPGGGTSDAENDRYGGNSLKDFDLTNPWLATKGVGEYFEYVVTEKNRPQNRPNLGFTEFYIFSGHRKNIGLWQLYSRPKKLKMYVNNEPYAYINLANTYKQQSVQFAPIGLAGKATSVKFEIVEVYAGKKPQVAIAEIAFDGIGIF